MQLEKLDLLEKRLNRFIEHFAQLTEENDFLRQRLETQAERLKELESEVEFHAFVFVCSFLYRESRDAGFNPL